MRKWKCRKNCLVSVVNYFWGKYQFSLLLTNHLERYKLLYLRENCEFIQMNCAVHNSLDFWHNAGADGPHTNRMRAFLDIALGPNTYIIFAAWILFLRRKNNVFHAAPVLRECSYDEQKKKLSLCKLRSFHMKWHSAVSFTLLHQRWLRFPKT